MDFARVMPVSIKQWWLRSWKWSLVCCECCSWSVCLQTLHGVAICNINRPLLTPPSPKEGRILKQVSNTDIGVTFIWPRATFIYFFSSVCFQLMNIFPFFPLASFTRIWWRQVLPCCQGYSRLSLRFSLSVHIWIKVYWNVGSRGFLTKPKWGIGGQVMDKLIALSSHCMICMQGVYLGNFPHWLEMRLILKLESPAVQQGCVVL